MLREVLVATAVVVLAPALAAQQAIHATFGSGCHERARASFAAWFPDAAAAAAVLNGQSLRLLPHANGYQVLWGGATYRVPGAQAVALPPSDDGQVAVVPTQPLPTPFGPWTTLWVHSNGFVAQGPENDGGAFNVPPNDYLPSAHYRQAPAAAFWAWHDWNPAEPGSGRILREEVWLGGERTLCLTWRDVENFPVGVENRGTFQFQFGLQTGRVAYVWVHVDADVSSSFGSAHLVGFSPAGPSLDPGFTTLPAGLPLGTAPDAEPLGLSASPAPVSTATAGTTVVYRTTAAPPAVAGSDLRLGVTALSLLPAPGLDLGFAGLPGCRAYVGALDVQLVWTASTPEADAAFLLPPGVPAGLRVFAQSLALAEPRQAGEAGLRTSNGLDSIVAPQ
ncbi:MAG: hypothetical protein KF830_00025 [Planctomycetes bacterium]|nr:hypothetical protein [Planctomycetota bacterium]